jgi:hypothetical protein
MAFMNYEFYKELQRSDWIAEGFNEARSGER